MTPSRAPEGLLGPLPWRCCLLVVALCLAAPALALDAPQPYVLAPDGVTQLTLEQAGILKPDGRPWAIALGKALFWDQDAGSDGQSCASCHYSAGADPRVVGVLTPGFLKEPKEDTSFGAIGDLDGEPLPGAPLGRTRSGGYPIDATYELRAEDFPLYALSDYRDRNSPVEIATDDAVSSPGSYDSAFLRTWRLFSLADLCGVPDATIFHAGPYAARQVEPRNTPTTVNAVFNLFNFWDGRANRTFNGVGVFGPRDIVADPRKRLIVLDAAGTPTLGQVEVQNASLASQAVGPPLSQTEMSCEGRIFADLGRKLLLRRPLAYQRIHSQDTVFGAAGPLGDLRSVTGRGLALRYLYLELVRRAFEPRYWQKAGLFTITPAGALKRTPLSGYTQMEHNFSLFWGISIALYESTLVSDRSRFDDCDPTLPRGSTVPICRSGNTTLTPQELEGFRLFTAFANTPHPETGAPRPGPACNACHALPLSSEAQFQAGQRLVPVERSRVDSRGPGTPVLLEGGVHDRGFFNIGVAPASFDPGNGGTDVYGNPLSLSRMFLQERLGFSPIDPSGITDPCNTPTLIEPGGTPRYPGCDANLADTTDSVDPAFDWGQERELVAGGFKTPTIRNVGLTPPYFHNGSYATLRQVVEFYDRGGSQRNKSNVAPGLTGDTSGTGPLGKSDFPVQGPDFGSNVDRFVQPLALTEAEIDSLTAFMLSMTDLRVQCDQAPFDHPSLYVTAGPKVADVNRDRRADDILFELPETGGAGYAPGSGLCVPNGGDLFAPGMQARIGRQRVALP